jgi:hypothetical protein
MQAPVIGVSPAPFTPRFSDRFRADRQWLIGALTAAGHTGPCDPEIICPAADCDDEYRRDRAFSARRIHEHKAA